MGHYLPETTIARVLLSIQKGELILPAIQREFVWKPTQVIGLFDSIMRGYPIGGFLSWKVEPKTVSQFRFYGFLKDFSEYDNRHNPVADPVPGQSVTAVLDGQQRLTSLNVGLRGSYAYRRKWGWTTNPDHYPVRRLYLNLLGEAAPNESGLRYDFRFFSEAEYKEAPTEASRFWFPVSKVLEFSEPGDVWDFAADVGLANDKAARTTLSQLYDAVHKVESIHFYEETDQDVERVLDIFIRVNSAGTVLSYSDLLLSIATAQWKQRDARDAIHGLVDALNATGQGFAFNQDNVLKAGLVLTDVSDVGFKVRNFTAATMDKLDQEWDAISASLKVAAGLLSDFGLSTATLSANSVLIPVAYYVHRRGLTQKYRESVADKADRSALRSWTLRSLITPGVWGAGLDTLLRDLRQAIVDQGQDGFPSQEIERRMAARGKSLVLDDGQIEGILDLAYGEKRTFAVLAILFPHVNTRHVHHVDHVFPQSLLTKQKLKKAGFDPDAVDRLVSLCDKLPNLQLLEGLENVAKSDTLPAAWVAKAYPDTAARAAFLDLNAIPSLADSVNDFEAAFAERRAALARRVKSILGGDNPAASEPAPASPLQAGIDDQPATADADL
jgi:hypothetical protein